MQSTQRKRQKSALRLVVYVTNEELKSSTEAARASGLKTPHQWLGSLMRRELKKNAR